MSRRSAKIGRRIAHPGRRRTLKWTLDRSVAGHDDVILTSIHTPTHMLAALAKPCNATNRRRLNVQEQMSGRLRVIPIATMPRIDPMPKTAMDSKPCPTSCVVDNTISMRAADPARPCAIPMLNGRRD